MGMFDYVRSEIPLPDGFTGELQSKDFDCTMTEIVIRANGRLEIERFEYETTPKDERPYPDADEDSAMSFVGCIRKVNRRWEDMDYHGDFEFYGYERVGPQTFVPLYDGAKVGYYKGETRWHEYVARFSDGQLAWVKDATQGIEAGTATTEGRGPKDESPSGKAGAPNNPLISTPTHKGEEGQETKDGI